VEDVKHMRQRSGGELLLRSKGGGCGRIKDGPGLGCWGPDRITVGRAAADSKDGRGTSSSSLEHVAANEDLMFSRTNRILFRKSI
jgi:hypothetical protein